MRSRLLQKWSLRLVALASLLGFAAPSRAEAGELQFEIHGGGQHAYDSSFDALGTGDTPNVYGSGMLGATYGVGRLVGLDGLSLYAGIGGGAAGTSRFDGAYQFSWERALYLVGAEYGYRLTPAIRPFGRISLGAARQSLSVTPNDGETFSQAQFQFATRNSVGIEFHTPFAHSDSSKPDRLLAISESVALGVTAQAGYLWQPAPYFGDLSGPSGGDSWRRSGVELGRLDTSGWFWAFGGSLRLRL